MKAPRFVAVGHSRVQVLEAVAHDPDESAAVTATLDALRPGLLLVDRTRAEWDGMRTGRLGPLDARLLSVVRGVKPSARPNVLWREVASWAANHGCRVGLIHPDLPDPPEGRKGLRGLDKLVRKEGFEASGPRGAVARYVDDYAMRVPDLRSWLVERRDLTARRLHAALARQPLRAVVLFAAPDADAVCDRLVVLHRSSPSRPDPS